LTRKRREGPQQVACDLPHPANVEGCLKSAEAKAERNRGHSGEARGELRRRGIVPRNNVQRFREALMMSKAELARKAGLSTLTVDRIEAGRPCRLDTKRKVLLALGLKVSDRERVFEAGEGAFAPQALVPADRAERS
jgi:DNA-binding XRE family transcriptional regulator